MAKEEETELMMVSIDALSKSQGVGFLAPWAI
jgi:hypothetical protein